VVDKSFTSAWPIERSEFGDQQTTCSRGMIHRGAKYAPRRVLDSASQVIACDAVMLAKRPGQSR
jgi:hypothetical protein